MKKARPLFDLTKAARRDIERCRLFLWCNPGGQPAWRIREIMREARRLTLAPKLYPVESIHPVSKLEFRRKNVGRFAVIYTYLEPTAEMPGGVVSVRAIHHGAEEDVFFRVEEPRAGSAGQHAAAGLFTGSRAGTSYAAQMAW